MITFSGKRLLARFQMVMACNGKGYRQTDCFNKTDPPLRMRIRNGGSLYVYMLYSASLTKANRVMNRKTQQQKICIVVLAFRKPGIVMETKSLQYLILGDLTRLIIWMKPSQMIVFNLSITAKKTSFFVIMVVIILKIVHNTLRKTGDIEPKLSTSILSFFPSFLHSKRCTL